MQEPVRNGQSLPDFIRANQDAIIREWEAFAGTLAPSADMTRLQLRDHIVEILSFISKDIERPQSAAQQFSKSRGEGDELHTRKDTAAETHGMLRHDDGFDIVQMVSEYRALRGSVVKLWTRSKGALSDGDMLELTRFNEAIDQALAESVKRFMQKVDYSKDLLLGVLGHDIRSPLGAMKMSAVLMPIVGSLNEKQAELAAQIEDCSARVNDIVANLLDLAHARLGSGLPIRKAAMDMGELALQVVEEMRVQHPGRAIELTTEGEMRGEWDATRMGQLFSNLVSNAVQYGAEDEPVEVAIRQEGGELSIRVHNGGDPISPKRIASIFDSFTRGMTSPDSGSDASNLGLGLFITREIVRAHGGAIDVVSSAEEGTAFSIRLSRQA